MALLVPLLDKMFLSERDLTDIRSQKLSPEQWSQLFVLLQSQVEICRKSKEDLCLTKVGGEDTQINVKDLAARVGRERWGLSDTAKAGGI